MESGSRSVFVILLAIAGLAILWAVVTGRASTIWSALSGSTATSSTGATSTVGSTSGGGAVNATPVGGSQVTPPTLVAAPSGWSGSGDFGGTTTTLPGAGSWTGSGDFGANATLPIAASPTQNYSVNTLPSVGGLALNLPGGGSATKIANGTNSGSLAAVNLIPLFSSTSQLPSYGTTSSLLGLGSLFSSSSYTQTTPIAVPTTTLLTPPADTSSPIAAALPAGVGSTTLAGNDVPSLNAYGFPDQE